MRRLIGSHHSPRTVSSILGCAPPLFADALQDERTLRAGNVLSTQKRGIKNLHQYPHARYKSLVKDSRRFARNWWLTAGNNYELVSEFGHEREATENFGIYRDDSANDRYILSTNRLADLPAAQRLDAIVECMRERWKVRDSNRGFDKAKLLLEALECFSEMKRLGQIKSFDALPERDQDTFLQYVEGCGQFAQACSHAHPEAASVVLRAAQICDEMGCAGKRDEMIQVAEGVTLRMERAYAFARPRESIRLSPPSLTEVNHNTYLRHQGEMAERFKAQPHVLEKKPPVAFFRGARNRKILHSPMKENDPRREWLQVPQRPESDSWSSS